MKAYRFWPAVAAMTLAGAAHAQPPGPVEHGSEVFQKWCAPCHGTGYAKPATAALAFKYKGEKPALLEQRTDLTPETVKQFVRHGVYTMPPFRKTEISDTDLDALAAYLSRNTAPAAH